MMLCLLLHFRSTNENEKQMQCTFHILLHIYKFGWFFFLSLDEFKKKVLVWVNSMHENHVEIVFHIQAQVWIHTANISAKSVSYRCIHNEKKTKNNKQKTKKLSIYMPQRINYDNVLEMFWQDFFFTVKI